MTYDGQSRKQSRLSMDERPQLARLFVDYGCFGFKRYLARSRKLIPQVQTAIGQQLRAELEVPRTLSPDLARLVSQLSFA